MYDMEVVKTAYETAKKLNASSKVMLALFEAGIVESGFRNINYGDYDSSGKMTTSRGFLQQKPEYWGGINCVMSVSCATTSFIKQAKQLENKYSTSGKLAQGVQKSAFPDKYDKVENEALALLKKIAGGEYTQETDDNIIDVVKNPKEAFNTFLLEWVNDFLPFTTKLVIFLVLVIIIFVSLSVVYNAKPAKILGGVIK
jgi:hypothetical protein